MYKITDGMISSLFPIRGYILADITNTLYGDTRTFELEVSHSEKGTHCIQFNIPEPQIDGSISVNGSDRVIINYATRGADFDLNRPSIKNLYIETQGKLLLNVIKEGLDRALEEQTPDESAIDKTIYTFLNTSPLIRFVDRTKQIDLQMNKATIYIDAYRNPLDYKERILEDHKGCIDLTTTTQGKYTGAIYRMVKGAKIIKNRIVPSNEILNRSMEKYLIFPENDRSDRILMARSIIAKHEELLFKEDPMVHHKEYDGALNGTHLLTAIMAHPLNYYDCIVVSKTAANKLNCIKRTKQTEVLCTNHLLVTSIGEEISAEDVLLYHPDERFIRTNKVKDKATVTDIQVYDSKIGRKTVKKIIFTFEEHYPLLDGDKLSSRHSSKGIVRIIEDAEMPEVNGVRAEVLIHPRSLVGRRNLGVMREIMANKKVLKIRETDPNFMFITEHFSNDWSFEQLIEEGYAEMDECQYGITVFNGPMYWLRTDKHVLDAFSVVGEEKIISGSGIDVDNGKAGQRLGPDVYDIMLHKGLKRTAIQMRMDSLNKEAMHRFSELLECLE